MITPKQESRDQPARDGRAVFLLGTVFLALGLFVLLHGMRNTAADVSVCAQNFAGHSTLISKVLVFMHWANVSAGLAYITLFVVWWMRRRHPWSETNDVAFSRVAWAGRRAWERAVQELRETSAAAEIALLDRLEWLAHVAAAIICIASTGILLALLLTCDACPSSWDHRCTASAAATAASGFILIIYFDLRIKFRRAKLKAP